MIDDNIPKPTMAKTGVSTSSAGQKARAVERTREANLKWTERRKEANSGSNNSSWKRETRQLPRAEAREFARAYLRKYPKAAYWSEVESWRVLDDDVIEFTMRRLPTAD